MNKECFLFAHKNHFGLNSKQEHSISSRRVVLFPYPWQDLLENSTSFVPGEIITNEFLRKHSLYSILPQVFICFEGFVHFQKTNLLKMSKSLGSACPHDSCPFICSLELQVKHCRQKPSVTDPGVVFIIRLLF